jgi:rhodanese-related sulfurtransferase
LPARLYREFDSGDYVVVDLRSFAAYNQAHIEDAVHIPFEELADRVGELDGNKTIVLYDLVMSESTSLAGAMMLYERGFSQVAVLEGGLQKWLSDGYPIKGSLLTPTPAAAGPPWTVTPLITATHTSVPTVVTATSTVSPTATTAQ